MGAIAELLSADSDSALLLMLAFILFKQGADTSLLLALLYIALDFKLPI